MRAGLAVLALLLFSALPAAAHNLPYSLATLTLKDGGWRVEMQCHTAALVAGLPQGHLPPEARAALTRISDADLAARAAAMADYVQAATVITVNGRRIATPEPEFPGVAAIREDGAQTPETARPSEPVILTGRLPPGATSLSVAFAPELGTVLLKVDGVGAQALTPGQASQPVAAVGPRPNALMTLGQYLMLGFTHILPGGLDHILFVLSLFLLSPRWKPLAAQVTAFTIAHSVTLALAVFDVVNLPSKVVETAIALSIAVVALDNVRTRDLARWRPLVVFGFGLLHGLGFANVLKELGLPRGQEALALVAFNLGIEGGQLAVLALSFAVLGWSLSRPWFRSRVAVPSSIVIALVAGVWAVQRALA